MYARTAHSTSVFCHPGVGVVLQGRMLRPILVAALFSAASAAVPAPQLPSPVPPSAQHSAPIDPSEEGGVVSFARRLTAGASDCYVGNGANYAGMASLTVTGCVNGLPIREALAPVRTCLTFHRVASRSHALLAVALASRGPPTYHMLTSITRCP